VRDFKPLRVLTVGMKLHPLEFRHGAQEVHTISQHHRCLRQVTLLAFTLTAPVAWRIELDNQIVKHLSVALITKPSKQRLYLPRCQNWALPRNNVNRPIPS